MLEQSIFVKHRLYYIKVHEKLILLKRKQSNI